MDFATAPQGSKADTAVQPSDLSDVATSGDYDDLDNKPTIPAQFNPIAGANMSITGTYPNMTFTSTGSGGGGGDMFKSVYDPNEVEADVYDMDNMTEGSDNKILTNSERNKLSGIEANATANDTDANLRDRATHTGTQTASTISDFNNAVSNNTDVEANTSARHTHSNKQILDNTTAC